MPSFLLKIISAGSVQHLQNRKSTELLFFQEPLSLQTGGTSQKNFKTTSCLVMHIAFDVALMYVFPTVTGSSHTDYAHAFPVQL